jgi:hypothetical protein
MNSGQGMNEWYVRLEAQTAVNEQLEQQRKWLELELEQAKQQINSGNVYYISIMCIYYAFFLIF